MLSGEESLLSETEQLDEQSHVEVVKLGETYYEEYDRKAQSALEAAKAATRARKERAKRQIGEKIRRRL
jgi:hypothetical protein